MKPAIAIKNLSVSYQADRILENFDFVIDAGSLLAIVGPNGSGKTTLIQSIMGLLPSTGTISIFDQPSSMQRHKIAYIPQRSSIDWSFPASVLDVVMMGRYGNLKFGQRPTVHDKTIALHAIEQVSMIDYLDRPIGQLSGGQQQRIFLARALAQQADILILDEPFVGVDIVTEQIMLDIFLELKSTGKTIVVVHHDVITVKKHFDAVCLINRKVIASGPMATTMTQENITRTFRGAIDLHDLTFL
jgi:manganese/zinc/iron transport system ATP- binding protein